MRIRIFIGLHKEEALRSALGEAQSSLFIPNLSCSSVGETSAFNLLTGFREYRRNDTRAPNVLISTDSASVIDSAIIPEITICDEYALGCELIEHPYYQRFKSAYDTGIQHMSEILRQEGIWK